MLAALLAALAAAHKQQLAAIQVLSPFLALPAKRMIPQRDILLAMYDPEILGAAHVLHPMLSCTVSLSCLCDWRCCMQVMSNKQGLGALPATHLGVHQRRLTPVEFVN